VTFSDFLDPDIEINNLGSVAFRGALSGSTATAGYFVGGIGVSPLLKLIEGQLLPDGETVASISTSINSFVGETFSLSDGELCSLLRQFEQDPKLHCKSGRRAAALHRERATGNGCVGRIHRPFSDPHG
jgi:hypothetical protein